MRAGSLHPAVIERSRRVARPWRIVFVVYALALMVATHWPALDLTTTEYPATDKIIHLYAFAGLTVLLWLTRWMRSWPVLLVIVSAWAILDEWSQGLPILERTYSWMDVIASELGVLVAAVWIIAVRPLGGVANRARLAMQRLVFEELFGSLRSPRGRLAWGLAAAGAIPTGLGLIFIWPIVVGNLPDIQWAIAYGLGQTALLGGLLLLFQRVWSRAWREALEQRRCPLCGESCGDVSPDRNGAVTCATCNTALHVGYWLRTPAPPARVLRRLAVGPIAVGFIVYLLGALLFYFYGSMLLLAWAMAPGRSESGAAGAVRLAGNLSTDFVMTVDFALLLASLAVLVLLYRRNLARWHDRQAQRCRVCRYDLRGTPLETGVGRCPECGSVFARFGAALPTMELLSGEDSEGAADS